LSVDPKAVRQFHDEGYAPVGPILTPDELAGLRAAYDRIFQATEKPSSYRNLGQREGEETSPGAVLQIIDMHKLDEAFRRILYKEELLDVAVALMDAPNLRLYHDQALYKPPIHGDVVPWHQDNGYWKLDPPRAASCWIALDDADTENGCMWVIPGSHRAGEVGHERAGHYIAQLKADADESIAVPIPLPAGSAMFHHCRTLHHTKPNQTPRQRRAWVIHYMPADTRQNGQTMPDRPLLRGTA
jgi:phytanoyl-CoA hydroxylase